MSVRLRNSGLPFCWPFWPRNTLLTLIFSVTTSHKVMKFCTLTYYIKDNILQLKMGSLVNVCPSEKLRFTFLTTGGVSMSSQTYACLGTTSYIVMKFWTLTHYMKVATLQLKMGSLFNVCPSEKLRFAFLLTFLTTYRAGKQCLCRHVSCCHTHSHSISFLILYACFNW